MDTDVPIFPSTGVSCSLWMHGDGIQGAKVTSYPSNLILKDFMVKTGFKFPLAGLGGCDFSSFLTSAEDDLKSQYEH